MALQVGRVTAVYWPGHEGVAESLAEFAAASESWPGLPAAGRVPLRIVVAPDRSTFDSLTHGAIPEWGTAVAYPSSNTVVIRVEGDPFRTLRHELAHLALHAAVGRVPRWFSEGYAVRSAGEWNRLNALRANLALVLRPPPSLATLNRDLRGGNVAVRMSYALAATAVLMLERMGGERGLGPLMERLAARQDLDRAMRDTYLVSLDQFEELWRRDMKKRYGWLSYLTSFTVFWLVAGAVLSVLWIQRRQRDLARKKELDRDWEVPQNDSVDNG